MSDEQALDAWQKIVSVLDEKLQYGFLEQVKSVVHVAIEGEELLLKVNSEEALDFFRADINQQRLFIVSRPIVSLSKISVELVEQET